MWHRINSSCPASWKTYISNNVDANQNISVCLDTAFSLYFLVYKCNMILGCSSSDKLENVNDEEMGIAST